MKKLSRVRKWTAVALAVMLLLGSNSVTKAFAATQTYSNNTHTSKIWDAIVECTVYAYFNYWYGTYVEVANCDYNVFSSNADDYQIVIEDCYTGGSSTAEVYAATWFQVWEGDGYWCYDSCAIAVYCDVYGNT